MAETTMGRPTKMTIETVGKLEACFNNGMTIVQACSEAGIHRDTYYEWLEKDKEFSDKMDYAQQFPNKKARQVLIESMNSGSYKAALAWLIRKDDEFKPRSSVEVTGKDGGAIQIALVDPAEAMKELQERLSKRADSSKRRNAGDPAKVLEPTE